MSSRLWDQYRWQVMTALAIVLLQAALIAWLLIERHRRRSAETGIARPSAGGHPLNRTATAGALSASFAHELNQPLGAILGNAEAAEILLASQSA